MKSPFRFPAAIVVLFVLATGQTFAAETNLAEPALGRMEWTIDGVAREAAVHVPKAFPVGGAPLVFVFHGRNNQLKGFVNYFPLHRGWPDAVVVYPQGLVMPGPKGRNANGTEKSGTGWQMEPGGQDDRDLKFFDAVLARLQRDYAIDPRRIYAAGHSNGAAFVYLLWQRRADTFAAFAPVAGGLWAARDNQDVTSLLLPKPVLQIAGRKDPTVKIELMEAMIRIVKRVNGCDPQPVPWADGAGELFASPRGAPVVTFIHPGGHGVPKEAVDLITRFFKEHRQP